MNKQPYEMTLNTVTAYFNAEGEIVLAKNTATGKFEKLCVARKEYAQLNQAVTTVMPFVVLFIFSKVFGFNTISELRLFKLVNVLIITLATIDTTLLVRWWPYIF